MITQLVPVSDRLVRWSDTGARDSYPDNVATLTHAQAQARADYQRNLVTHYRSEGYSSCPDLVCYVAWALARTAYWQSVSDTIARGQAGGQPE